MKKGETRAAHDARRRPDYDEEQRLNEKLDRPEAAKLKAYLKKAVNAALKMVRRA